MNQTHTIVKGDTKSPVLFRLQQGQEPVDLAGLTVKVVGKKDDGTEWISEAETGVTAHPTNVFTVDAATDKLKHNRTPVANGDQIIVASGTTLPAGLTAATRYFVVSREPNAFQVALVPDGAPVSISDTGTGTHTYYVVGSVAYAWQTADVAAAGLRWLWLRVYASGSSTAYDTFPVVRLPTDRGFAVEIVEVA